VSDLLFRMATDTDIPAIEALVGSAYRGDQSRAGWTTEADLLDGQRIDAAMLGEELSRPDAVVILAHDRSVPGGVPLLLGCAQIAVTRSDAGYFGMFAVAPAAQGRGLGSKLLAEAERRLADGGASTVELTVIEQRPELVAFYERRGYARTGSFRAFPYGDERFGVPLRGDLRLVVLEKDLLRH